MLTPMCLALLPTEKDHFRAKNNNLFFLPQKTTILVTSLYWHVKSVDFFRVFKNGDRGTKPTYIFMVIELKATLKGNPSNDFYWEAEI